jgi:hypothetical protein
MTRQTDALVLASQACCCCCWTIPIGASAAVPFMCWRVTALNQRLKAEREAELTKLEHGQLIAPQMIGRDVSAAVAHLESEGCVVEVGADGNPSRFQDFCASTVFLWVNASGVVVDAAAG